MSNLESYIQEGTKAAIDAAVNYIGADSDLFDEAYEYFFSENRQYASRASRVVNYVLEKHPFLLERHIEDFIQRMGDIQFETIRGTALRVFTFYEIPKDDDLISILANLCFDIIDKPSKKVAPKVYALDVLYRISNIEPDLKGELKTIIEIMLPYGSGGIQSRGGKILQKLNKELKMNNL